MAKSKAQFRGSKKNIPSIENGSQKIKKHKKNFKVPEKNMAKFPQKKGPKTFKKNGSVFPSKKAIGSPDTNVAVSSIEKKAKKGDDISFDEESIKKRVLDMFEDFKGQGGVLEIGEDSDDVEENEISSMDDDDDGIKGESSEADDEENEKSDTASEADSDTPKNEKKPNDRAEKREKRKFDFERNSRTIFVGNLPNTLDHKGVAKLFKCCGPVEAARIRSVVPEKEKLPPKVALIKGRMHPKIDSFNAYVVFKTNENDECIKKALAMNGKVIDGHHIRVDRAQRPKAKKETLTSRKKSVFVGNLRFDLRDDELINHFSKIGSVNYVRIVRDRSSGLGKGFGFVAFDDRASATKALEFNDTQFKGRSLRVKKVEGKETKG